MMNDNWIVPVLLSTMMSAFTQAAEPGPIDPKATAETKALFHNLRAQMGKGILFGHQHTTLYGIGWKAWEEGYNITLSSVVKKYRDQVVNDVGIHYNNCMA